MNLNLVKNYKEFTNGVTFDEQLEKIKEEFMEVEEAFGTGFMLDIDKADLIGELMDLITATYNMIYKVEPDFGFVDKVFKDHIKKLEGYRSKYPKKVADQKM